MLPRGAASLLFSPPLRLAAGRLSSSLHEFGQHHHRPVVTSLTPLDRLVLPVVSHSAGYAETPLSLRARVRLAIEKLKRPRLQDEYDLFEEIGRGRFGVVHRVIHRETQRVACCKSIRKYRPGEVTCRKNPSTGTPLEVEAMSKLLPGGLQLYSWYETPLYVHIVMEYLHGGTVFSLMNERGWEKPRNAAQEAWTASLVASMLKALILVHDSGVVHLDVKPDGFAFRHSKGDFLASEPAVAIDFGFARPLPKEPTRVLQTIGSPSFVAPEIRFDHVYSAASDAYSFGVVTFALLMGFMPFDVSQCTTRSDFESVYFCPIDWKGISTDAQDFTKALLVADPNKRMSVRDAAEHQWLRGLMT